MLTPLLLLCSATDVAKAALAARSSLLLRKAQAPLAAAQLGAGGCGGSRLGSCQCASSTISATPALGLSVKVSGGRCWLVNHLRASKMDGWQKVTRCADLSVLQARETGGLVCDAELLGVLGAVPHCVITVIGSLFPSGGGLAFPTHKPARPCPGHKPVKSDQECPGSPLSSTLPKAGRCSSLPVLTLKFGNRSRAQASPALPRTGLETARKFLDCGEHQPFWSAGGALSVRISSVREILA